MLLPREFVNIVENNIRDNLKLLSIGKIRHNPRTSKTPRNVTNKTDFHFGQYMGGMKKALHSAFEKMYGIPMSEDQWDEFNNIFIDYQDELAGFFYKNQDSS